MVAAFVRADNKEYNCREDYRYYEKEYRHYEEEYDYYKGKYNQYREEYPRVKEEFEAARKELFNKLRDFGNTDGMREIEKGGRIRFIHEDGPKVSMHEHVLRMDDPTDPGRLLEIFFGDTEDTLGSHPSRGTLISVPKGAAGGESVPASKEAEDERKKQEIVRNIGSLPDEVFLRLAKEAATAQALVAEAAKEANQNFIDALGDDLVAKIGTRTQADLDEENRQKELQRKNPKGK